MPRVRHIRGILFEDEAESRNSESPTKTAKRKSDTEAGKPAKIKKRVSTSDIAKQSSLVADDEEIGEYGSFGKPIGILYVCTLCCAFKTKHKYDMRDHLYRDMKYLRSVS